MEAADSVRHRGFMTSSLTQLGPVVDANTPVRHAAQWLRNTLRLNTVTSLAGGLVLVVAPGPLNRLLGTESPGWVRLVGAGLVLFALDVGALSGTRIRRLIATTPLVSIGDGAWTVASAATIRAGWYSTPGAVIVGLVAVMVGTFGVRQLIQVHRLRLVSAATADSVLDEAPPTEVCHIEATIDTSPAAAWSVLTDHELYGRLAPNLSAVSATGPNGPDLTRTCANRRGEEWHETCTVWHEGRQYDVAVDTSNYPYPFTEMRGSWWTSDAVPTRVGMDFRYRPRPGLRGRVFATAMQAGFPLVLRRITRGWRRAVAVHQRPPAEQAVRRS